MYVWVCVRACVRESYITVVDANLSYEQVWRSQDFFASQWNVYVLILTSVF